MVQWPICVELPPGLSAELASWPDNPEILHDAVERLHAARSALARELGAGIRARRGDAVERAAWSALAVRAPDGPPERAGARDAGVGSTRARLAQAFGAEDAEASPDEDRRRSAAVRTPSSSSPSYRRLPSSQLRGMYSLRASAEFRAAQAAARHADGRVEQSVSGAGRSPTSPPKELVLEKRVDVDVVADADVEADADAHTSRARFRFRDAEALALAVTAPSTSDGSARVFLCAAARPGSEAAKRAPSRRRACFLLERRSDEKTSSATPSVRHSVVTTRLPERDDALDARDVPSRTSARLVAFGAAPEQPWVAVADGGGGAGRGANAGVRVFPLDGSRCGVGAFLDAPFAPTRLTASSCGEWLAASGERGVAALWRARDVREAIGAEARAAAARPARASRELRVESAAGGRRPEACVPEATNERNVTPFCVFAPPRYGGVAPKGDVPDVLAFSDDGRTLAAVHDGALFATWTLDSADARPGKKTEEPAVSSPAWRLSGVSYSTSEMVCDSAAHVFGEASDAEEEDAEDAFGFAFGADASAAFEKGNPGKGNTRTERPSLLVAVARAKPKTSACIGGVARERPHAHVPARAVAETRASGPRRVRVGLLDHTAGRGEAHRGAVFGEATDDASAAFGSRQDSEPSGSGFDPVALAGARGGYAAVVGADGAAYVWDVVSGATLDAWTVVDASRPEAGTRRDVRNVRVALASARGVLDVAVAFETGDDVVVETRRVRITTEETSAERTRACGSKRRRRTHQDVGAGFR